MGNRLHIEVQFTSRDEVQKSRTPAPQNSCARPSHEGVGTSLCILTFYNFYETFDHKQRPINVITYFVMYKARNAVVLQWME